MTDQGRSFDTVRIDALICGPGFQERMKEQRVIEIAERIASGRDVSTPIVRASDMSVIAGEDVVAAFCVLDGEELEVELVHDGSFDDELPTELSPDGETRYGLGVAAAEAERTELTPLPDELQAARATAANLDTGRAESGAMAMGGHRDTLEAVQTTPVPPACAHDFGYVGSDGTWYECAKCGAISGAATVVGGQSATLDRVKAAQAKGATQRAAITAVALETGKTEHAVKKAANRARRAKDKVSIETWGREQPEAWLASTSELRRTMTNASNAIRTAMSAVTTLMNGPPVPCVDLPGTYEELKGRAAKLRDARPACVCAWCKNEPALVERCTACGGRGWLGEQAMSLVPKELFPAESAMSAGRPVELEPVSGAHRCGTAYDGSDGVPLESRSHTVERPTKEQAEAAWQALEKANGGEAFLDDAVFEDVPEDGDVW